MADQPAPPADEPSEVSTPSDLDKAMARYDAVVTPLVERLNSGLLFTHQQAAMLAGAIRSGIAAALGPDPVVDPQADPGDPAAMNSAMGQAVDVSLNPDGSPSATYSTLAEQSAQTNAVLPQGSPWQEHSGEPAEAAARDNGQIG